MYQLKLKLKVDNRRLPWKLIAGLQMEKMIKKQNKKKNQIRKQKQKEKK